MTELLDCLVIGGGPAGLTAAIYLARFRLTAKVVDAGASRAALIPCTRNHAGFPDGISGRDLLDRMSRQAVKMGATIALGKVSRLSLEADRVLAETTVGQIQARAVLLATGVTNRRPTMSDDLHSAALAAGRLRYCPVCDGFEVIDQAIAVIGTGSHAVKEALFLRAHTARVTLISLDQQHTLSTAEHRDITEAGIVLQTGPVADFRLTPEGLAFRAGVALMAFEAVYPALGSDVHSTLAKALGAELSEENNVKVDAHQRTSVRGLYAAGDVVIGLDQISHAMGEAGVAATTIRNDLAAQTPLRR